MTLAAGAKLGPYEILSPLGAGGIGEVYRERDTRLGREVALKVLSENLAGWAEARERIERGARAVAALSHLTPDGVTAAYSYARNLETLYAVKGLK